MMPNYAIEDNHSKKVDKVGEISFIVCGTFVLASSHFIINYGAVFYPNECCMKNSLHSGNSNPLRDCFESPDLTTRPQIFS